MPVNVLIPQPLRKLTGDQPKVTASGTYLREVIDDLERNYPGIRERLLDEEGNRRRFVLLYVNGEDVRFGKDLDTPVNNGYEISIIPQIAGGSGRISRRPY